MSISLSSQKNGNQQENKCSHVGQHYHDVSRESGEMFTCHTHGRERKEIAINLFPASFASGFLARVFSSR
jgi:hypothetical protein